VLAPKLAHRDIEVIRPQLNQAAACDRSQVAAVEMAQESSCLDHHKRDTEPSKPPQLSFDIRTNRVPVCYAYLPLCSFVAVKPGLHRPGHWMRCCGTTLAGPLLMNAGPKPHH
jgi:hypothetical protein